MEKVIALFHILILNAVKAYNCPLPLFREIDFNKKTIIYGGLIKYVFLLYFICIFIKSV